MKARLICLIRRHQWHNGSNDYEHQTVWTCNRCGESKGDSGDSGDAGSRLGALPWVSDLGGGGL